ncbi:MAG: alpha/beta fold hydrolase [Myxococcota bacterium]
MGQEKNRRVWMLALAVAMLTVLIVAVTRPTVRVAPHEHTGAFRFADGELVAFIARDDGCLRVVLEDGQVGRVCPDHAGAASYDGASYFSGAGPDSLRVTFTERTVNVGWGDGQSRVATLCPIRREPVDFAASDGVSLVGELILPEGEKPAPVLVHVGGSERSAAVGRVWMPYLLAARGVASFVYDKRGVGGSDGSYTQDFQRLGADAAAAVDAARLAMGDRRAAIGIVGFSQGGWVGPLAASTADVDAVIVAFGLAVSPVEEEVSEVAARLAAAGHGRDILGRSRALVEAGVVLADSDFSRGTEVFGKLKKQAEAEGWLEDIGSEGLTGALARYPVFFVRSTWSFFDTNTSWSYDPKSTLASLDTPQLWLLGGQDKDAPSASTQTVLRELAASGNDIEVEVYETADHGLVERVGGPEGPASRFVEGYWQAVANFMLGIGGSTP